LHPIIVRLKIKSSDSWVHRGGAIIINKLFQWIPAAKAWIGFWALILLPLSVWSQLKENYVVRSQSSLKSPAMASTSDSDCKPTGVQRGVMVQVLCDKNGRVVKGWVNRKAVDTRVLQNPSKPLSRVNSSGIPNLQSDSIGINPHNPAVSTRNSSATGQIRPVETRLAAARISPYRGGGEFVNDFLSVIFDNSPKRLKETRVVNRRSKKRASVDLVQLPTYPDPSGQGVQMACGSQHIRNDRSPPYATALTACLITGVAQEWREKFCPDNNPDCRMMIGDGSHGAKIPDEWPHNTHRDGTCFDIWPIRKAGGGLKEVEDYNDPVYSRERTVELVKLLQKWGSDRPGGGKDIGNQLFFNDAKLRDNGKRLTRSIRNHDGHIHVCFRDNETNRKRCDGAKFDTKLCPDLMSPKSAPGVLVEDRNRGQSSQSTQF